jgi:hypothetical protein
MRGYVFRVTDDGRAVNFCGYRGQWRHGVSGIPDGSGIQAPGPE